MEVRGATAEDQDALLALQREVQALHVAAHPQIYREPLDEELRRAMLYLGDGFEMFRHRMVRFLD